MIQFYKGLKHHEGLNETTHKYIMRVNFGLFYLMIIPYYIEQEFEYGIKISINKLK